MKESTQIELINALFVFAWLFLTNGLTLFVTEEHSDRIVRESRTKHETFQVRPTEPEPIKKNQTDGAYYLKDKIDRLDIKYDYIDTEYVGVCFVTAYCPAECGYVEYEDGTDNFPRGWVTATDTICHYSESNWEPTTCAIDRNYFDFGEYLMIDGKTYVTEDTGAFRGMWVDCFVETMYEVETWETGYYPVYSVEFKTNELIYPERKRINEWLRNFNRVWRCGFRFPDRDCD